MTATEKPILPFDERQAAFGIALTAAMALLSRSISDCPRINRRPPITTATVKQILRFFDLRPVAGIYSVRQKDFWRCSLVWEMMFRFRILWFVRYFKLENESVLPGIIYGSLCRTILRLESSLKTDFLYQSVSWRF